MLLTNRDAGVSCYGPVTSAASIPEEDEGKCFIVTLLTKDRRPGRSGNELKGAVIRIVRPY